MPSACANTTVTTPRCPSCSTPLEDLTQVCPRCRFTAVVCARKYPYHPPRLERFLDAENRLTKSQRRRLHRAVDRFERIFPQITFYVCITRLPRNDDCREFGYWLFNASTPVDQADEQRRFHSILLVIDRNNRGASLTIGYGLDQFIGDQVLYQLIGTATAEFKSGKYPEGILKVLFGFEFEFKAISVAADPRSEPAGESDTRLAADGGAQPFTLAFPT